MQVLALDAASNACSAALWRDGQIVARRFQAMVHGHAEVLMPMVQAVAAEAGVAFDAVDLFAVTVGPGAFTGIRISLAAARGMALAAGRPCLGVTTMAAVAEAVPEAERQQAPLLVVLETKRADVYVQFFAPDLTPFVEARALPLGELVATAHALGRHFVVVGDAAARVAGPLTEAGIALERSGAPGLPDAAVVAQIAARRWQALGTPAALEPPRPLYLRAPDVTFPGGRNR
jgi:tRNA threonylcarbamoyladenosine biosynthesis protein TsaB